MGKKQKNRARAAARGTAADPARMAMAGGERLGSDARLVGTVPQTMAEEIAGRSGVAPFTFRSALILGAATVLGVLVIPYIASLGDVPANVSVLVAFPLLLALALAFTRCFIDTDRGFSRAFVATFGITFAATLLICWLALYQGMLPF